MPSFRPLHIGTVMQSNLRASMGQGYKNVCQAEGKLLQGSREKQRSRIPKVSDSAPSFFSHTDETLFS